MINEIEECFGASWNFDIGRQVEVHHVMGDVSLFLYMALACGAEGFNSVGLTLFHLDGGVCFDAWDGFSCVNLIGINGVAIQILDHFYWICSSLDLNLVGLHGFLDQTSKISQSDVYPSLSYSSVCGILDGFEQIVVGWIESYRECSVNNPTVDMGPEIDFHNIVFLKNSVVSRVGSVVGGAVVDGSAGWESNT